jgi:predicted ATPase
MRLSRIEIENCEGIGATKVIHLKPTPLLSGPNSTGRSTILHTEGLAMMDDGA